jgi:hypothetical protein
MRRRLQVSGLEAGKVQDLVREAEHGSAAGPDAAQLHAQFVGQQHQRR